MRGPSLVLSRSEVFEEEVADIGQVLCERELFEFELTDDTDHPPLANVEGNLRRKLEFWKRIGTLKFILNIIEREYMLYLFLVFRNQQHLKTKDHPLPMLNLSRMLYVNYIYNELYKFKIIE